MLEVRPPSERSMARLEDWPDPSREESEERPPEPGSEPRAARDARICDTPGTRGRNDGPDEADRPLILSIADRPENEPRDPIDPIRGGMCREARPSAARLP